MEYNYDYGYDNGNNIPLPFDTIRELADVGCQMLTIAQCDGLPSSYEKTLCRFETVHIQQIMTDTAPSAVPVIQLLLNDTKISMRSYSCDAKEGSSFLTEDDIKELDLEKYRLNMECELYDTFFLLDAHTEFYILIVEQERNEFGRLHCLPQDFERPRPTGRMVSR